jgi:chromosomal replication initiator protein
MLCEPCLEHPLKYPSTRKILTSNDIINKVCDIYGYSPTLVCGKLRWKKLVEARMVIAHLLRNDKYLEMSLKSIGYMLGRRDHTTIIHNIRTIEDSMEIYPDFRLKVIDIYEKIYGNSMNFY